jgi:hypothetical protein
MRYFVLFSIRRSHINYSASSGCMVSSAER